jgi:gliding motility-associated-like protein
MRQHLFISLLFALFLIYPVYFLQAQPEYGFTITAGKEICTKAAASLQITGTLPSDTVKIEWSTGETDILRLNNLSGGYYSVSISIKRFQDSTLYLQDTTLLFSVPKENCPVTVDKYFSPNGDNYHDVMSIVNAQFYPNFELNIFNKWGQKVHTQSREYQPWDGKWNGIDLPDGTYYYVFFFDSEEKTKLTKGDVTILR